jgi:DNA replication licensing factor MCM6
MASIPLVPASSADLPQSSLSNQSVGRVLDELGLLVSQGFLKFLQEFQVELTENDEGVPSEIAVDESNRYYYWEQGQTMTNNDSNTMYINYSHLNDYAPELCLQITLEYNRFESFLCMAVQRFMQEKYPNHRRFDAESGQGAYLIHGRSNKSNFFIAFHNLPNISTIRDLKTNKIGSLISISGTVTRTSTVRPELFLASFQCGNCSQMLYNVQQQFKYTQPKMCINPQCSNNKNWQLVATESVFIDW